MDSTVESAGAFLHVLCLFGLLIRVSHRFLQLAVFQPNAEVCSFPFSAECRCCGSRCFQPERCLQFAACYPTPFLFGFFFSSLWWDAQGRGLAAVLPGRASALLATRVRCSCPFSVTLVLVFSVLPRSWIISFSYFFCINFARGDRVTLVLHSTYTGNTEMMFVYMPEGESATRGGRLLYRDRPPSSLSLFFFT